MNPQYAPPQHFGMPPSPYGGDPSQPMPPNGQPLPHQQQFTGQQPPGPNSFTGYPPNAANSQPQMNLPPLSSLGQPMQKPSLQPPVQHDNSFPAHSPMPNQPNAYPQPPAQSQIGGNPPPIQHVMPDTETRPQNGPQMQQPPMRPPSMGPPMQQPSMNQPPMQQPSINQPPMQQPTINQPPIQQSPMHQPSMHMPLQQPSMQSPPTQQSSLNQPPMQQPPINQPPMQQPTINQPPINQPPMQQPTINQPPIQQSPLHQPSLQQPTIQQPQMHQPPTQGIPGPPRQFPSSGHPMRPGPGMPMPPRPGTTLPHPSNVDNLSGQMTGMHLNGPMPPNQQMNMSGGPPTNYNHPGMPPMPGQRYPPVNGGPGPQMNGVPDPNAPRPPMQQRYPQDNMQNLQGGYPPAMTSPPGGYPPQGFPPQPSPFPAAQPSYPSGQQAQRRLDPDMMPSPMQVIEEDQRLKSGLFHTNQKGQVPPLVTSDFIAVDQGNANPRFMRSTMYNIPITEDMMKQTAVPFALAISPMAELMEEEQIPPIVDFGEIGPVRCVRCKAYMSPNMQFFEGGRKFLCLLCKAATEVPAEYFQHLDHTGLRVDRFERAELICGAYDIIATKEYCRDGIPPKPPALIFLIDVSYNNIKSGLVSLLCAQMKSFLSNLPKERGQEKSSLRVGFITYNSSVHFYNINPNLGQPQMLVVGDVQEMFMPLLDGFLVDVEQSEALIDMLMEQIPTMFADTRETETILAPAIQAGLEALKAAGCAGKLFVFHSSLPIFDAPGKLTNRDDRKLLGTDKEKTVLSPQGKVYNNLAQDCVQFGCSVDLYIFNNSFIDLATIGQVARLTGGEVYKYTYFQADLDGERVVGDVRANVRRQCAFDAVMRVRTSAGVRPTEFYGHFFMSNTTDVEFAALDPDKAVAVEIKHDDKLSEEEGVYIQTALLYTSLSGQRRIRILNLALKACSQMGDLFRTCELDTMMNFFTKQAVHKLLEASPKAIRENYIQRSAQILACYRKNCASPTSSGQLILPECMKLLPLYMNCMLKCDAVSGGSDMTIDDRWFTMAAATTMDVPSSVVYLYPRLLSIEGLAEEICTPVRCSAEKMSDSGIYLLENGIYMFLWLGLAAPPDWISSVFGVPSSSQVDVEKNKLPVLDNPLSEKIREFVSSVGSGRHRSMRLTVVRQRDKMELVMKHFLVEDKGLDGSASYVDFLCHLHKEIRSIVS